ncbi:hypothetical protein HD554DRAFT_2036361 [Boletus coccyginus]|nr:hypothetical protein HD554DRAFT_2036361 [Boletus coccyginus]
MSIQWMSHFLSRDAIIPTIETGIFPRIEPSSVLSSLSRSIFSSVIVADFKLHVFSSYFPRGITRRVTTIASSKVAGTAPSDTRGRPCNVSWTLTNIGVISLSLSLSLVARLYTQICRCTVNPEHLVMHGLEEAHHFPHPDLDHIPESIQAGVVAALHRNWYPRSTHSARVARRNSSEGNDRDENGRGTNEHLVEMIDDEGTGPGTLMPVRHRLGRANFGSERGGTGTSTHDRHGAGTTLIGVIKFSSLFFLA